MARTRAKKERILNTIMPIMSNNNTVSTHTHIHSLSSTLSHSNTRHWIRHNTRYRGRLTTNWSSTVNSLQTTQDQINAVLYITILRFLNSQPQTCIQQLSRAPRTRDPLLSTSTADYRLKHDKIGNAPTPKFDRMSDWSPSAGSFDPTTTRRK